ncbi:Hypothetical predicted protein [Olea europaea subsp. europaea]|uniref:Bromodomain associated domain-containing protein n=1 Tax=Olea europaea subsp. europaea TaxID=158383 RepID=A0A8S0SEP1_OLEEU|nr:Hypothetical predicted protein [Olea europaea subsp. europaea]
MDLGKKCLEIDKKKNETPGNDDFAQAIARIAVTQGFQQSALDTLSDVGVRYIREIVKIATACANLDNRNECNVFDVIQGLEDLGSVQGFSGASDVNHCLTRSRVIRDIIQYAEEAEEFPSAYPIPTFPVVKERKLIEERHMQVERSPLNLQQKLIFNGLEAGLADEPAKAKCAVESNPFLAPPLQFEDKENHAALESHVSVLEPCAHAIEDIGTQSCKSMKDRRKIPLNERTTIKFKFRNSRTCSSTAISPWNEGVEKIALWFGVNHDEKHDKKKRSGQILRETMDNLQGITCSKRVFLYLIFTDFRRGIFPTSRDLEELDGV